MARAAGLTTCLFVLASARVSLAAEPGAAPGAEVDQRAVFKLVVNEVTYGEIPAVLRGDEVFVRRGDLEEAGLRDFRATDLLVDGELRIALSSVRPRIVYKIDDIDVALRLAVPAEILPPQKIDASGAPPETEYQQDASAFLNYAPRIFDFNRFDTFFELAGSERGRLYYTGANVSTKNGAVRGFTNITLDDRPKLRRLVIGDTVVNNGPLGGALTTFGLTLTRQFSLDPYQIQSPALSYTGTAYAPGTLDVYANGVRIRREEIGPGNFQVSNLRPPSGGGVVTYVVRDVLGRETRIIAPYYFAAGGLKKGASQYTYSVGFQRLNVGTESFDYRAPVFMARHRAGLDGDITFGARAEATPDHMSTGAFVTKLSRIGQIDLELGTSIERLDRLGVAAFLSYGYTSQRFGAFASVRAASAGYSTSTLGTADARSILDASASVSAPLGTRGGVSATYTLSQRTNEGIFGRIGLQFTQQVSGEAHLLVTANRTHYPDGSAPIEGFATLAIALGNGHNISAALANPNGAPQAVIDAHRSLPLGLGYGYRASATLGEQERLQGTAQYQSQFAQYSADVAWDVGRDPIVTLGGAGAIVLVRKVGLFATLPITESFGVIRIPGLKGVRGRLNNQEVGRTDSRGNLLVPRMLSYYANRLSIEDRDVPMTYSIDATEKTIAPPNRGAAIAEFPIKLNHFYRGKLIVSLNGHDTVPEYGELTLVVGKSEVASPLSKTGEFELEGIPAGQYRATIVWEKGTCKFAIDIPDGTEAVVAVGVRRCVIR